MCTLNTHPCRRRPGAAVGEALWRLPLDPSAALGALWLRSPGARLWRGSGCSCGTSTSMHGAGTAACAACWATKRHDGGTWLWAWKMALPPLQLCRQR